MHKLAPIILFTYNRPWHTRQTLEALAKNELADESTLYIYCDGPKEGASEEQLSKITELRSLVKSKQWCKEVYIVERERNWGLADSVIDGVTTLTNQYGRVIVLEDDIITSPGFLKYMNDALMLYADTEEVMHISGYMFPVKGKLPLTFFYNTASCWGWATWKRAWVNFRSNASNLLKDLEESGRITDFTIDNTADFRKQLVNNITKQNHTWAVKWYASFFLKGGYALHPYPSLTNNIGFDGSGENCDAVVYEQNKYYWPQLANGIEVKKQPVKEHEQARDLMKRFYTSGVKYHTISWKNKLAQLLPHIVYQWLYQKIHPTETGIFSDVELVQLKGFPRYKKGVINIPAISTQPITFPDAASFQFIVDEIIEKEIYTFITNKKQPVIIDGGANIGIGVLYFKQKYPNAIVHAFEPDAYIYEILQRNTQHLSDVHLYQKGLWSETTTLSFDAEGADGGKIANNKDGIIINTVPLSDYLHSPIELLKLDIEGAEFTVLNACQAYLHQVQNLFVEYHSFVGQEQNLPELLTILKNAGFRLHINAPGLSSAQPLSQIQTYAGMDMQLNIYGYRIQ